MTNPHNQETAGKVEDTIRKILDGIDRDELDDNGWWETSEKVKFGAKKLQEVLDAVRLAANKPLTDCQIGAASIIEGIERVKTFIGGIIELHGYGEPAYSAYKALKFLEENFPSGNIPPKTDQNQRDFTEREI